MKEFLKELVRPKPINWRQTISIWCLMAICVFMGILIGYKWGTGELPTFTESEGISVPETVITTTADVQETLEQVPFEEYGFGYNCVDIAWAAARALEWQGQPSRVAGIFFESGSGHTIVLTATTDEGGIYVDPQTGLTLMPRVGGMMGGHRITGIGILDYIPIDVWLQGSMFEVIVK